MPFVSRLVVSLLPFTMAAAALASTAPAIEPRILAQEGLAIALASTVLQSQLEVLIHSGSTAGGCTRLSGGGSVKTISVTTVSSTVRDSDVDIYYDLACQNPYLEAAARITTSSNKVSTTETATYLGLQGQGLGSLTLSESDTSANKTEVLIGLGQFAPASGAPKVDLGLTCTLPTSTSAKTVACEGGVAQTFPALNLSLASVTPLTLTGKKVGKVTSINFAGKSSTMQTGPAGSLSITTPTANSLGIGGGGAAYGSAVTKGHAARFVLFPPTPTHWTVVDKPHDAMFSLQLQSGAARASKATVTTISSGAALATISVDQSGSGTIAYMDGTSASISSWLLAE